MTRPDGRLREKLEAQIEEWRGDAYQADADGDYCCALTRRNDADTLEALLAAVPVVGPQQDAKPCNCGADLCIQQRSLLLGYVCIREVGLAAFATTPNGTPARSFAVGEPPSDTSAATTRGKESSSSFGDEG